MREKSAPAVSMSGEGTGMRLPRLGSDSRRLALGGCGCGSSSALRSSRSDTACPSCRCALSLAPDGSGVQSHAPTRPRCIRSPSSAGRCVCTDAVNAGAAASTGGERDASACALSANGSGESEAAGAAGEASAAAEAAMWARSRNGAAGAAFLSELSAGGAAVADGAAGGRDDGAALEEAAAGIEMLEGSAETELRRAAEVAACRRVPELDCCPSCAALGRAPAVLPITCRSLALRGCCPLGEVGAGAAPAPSNAAMRAARAGAGAERRGARGAEEGGGMAVIYRERGDGGGMALRCVVKRG